MRKKLTYLLSSFAAFCTVITMVAMPVQGADEADSGNNGPAQVQPVQVQADDGNSGSNLERQPYEDEPVVNRDPMKNPWTNEERREAARAALVRNAQAKADGAVSPAATLVPTPGSIPDIFGPYPNYANSQLPEIDASGNVIPGSGIRKFVDGLPRLGSTAANNLGQYISVAHADTKTYPGSDYYEIAAVQYQKKMHTDLAPTTLRGYVQLNNGTDPGSDTNTIAPDPVQYLGPAIVATKDKPVRIKFTNLLPNTASGGVLSLPVDVTIMGAGPSPDGSPYPDNRAGIHLHGGMTPWISDGTANQWVAPNLQPTTSPKGASTQDVSDMPVSPGGSVTLYYTNQQSARLMFYHDHAVGITRLNVYYGLAAPYLVTDDAETALVSGGLIPGTTYDVPAGGVVPADQIPLVIQDKTFVPDNTRPYTNSWGTFPSQLDAQDPSWNWGPQGSLWLPHVYHSNENPYSVGNGLTPMGRWDYGPWTIGAPPIIWVNGPVANPYYVNGGDEPPVMPGTPNPTITPEAFMDTPVVNGTAYPTLTVDPKAYRFRILNAANDRFFNLSLFKAAPLAIGVTQSGSGYTSPPLVGILGGSVTGATPTALLGVVSYTITNAGSGYTSPPTVKIMSTSSGSGADAEAILTPGGAIDSLLVITAGAGYTALPTVTIDPPRSGTQATATAVLGVTRVTVTGGTADSGPIVTPTITIAPPPAGPGNTQAKAYGSVLTEVPMVPAQPDPSIPFPSTWMQRCGGNFPLNILDGRPGGVPDPRAIGPSWVVIGNEGGFLPEVAVRDPSPVGFDHAPIDFIWNDIVDHGLHMAPAERYDAVVDFSDFAGQTLILYSDNPAPSPVGDWRYDFYTGDSDQSSGGGAPETLAGYGPNIRTIMQIRVSPGTPAPFDTAPLEAALPVAYKATQPPPIVPQAAYNTAFGTNYPDNVVFVRPTDVMLTPSATPTTVSSVNLINRGVLYYTSSPTVTLHGGGGTGATATTTLLDQGTIDDFLMGNPGSGYTSEPTVTITGGGGTGAQGRAIIVGGLVQRIDIVNGGSGYITHPNVAITGGGGTGAQAAAIVGTAFQITSPGAGYTVAPAVTLSAPPAGGTQATATASLGIASVTLVTVGSYPSYTVPPVITVTGGGGSGAVLVPVMSLNPIPGTLGGGYSMAAVAVVCPGSGYTTAPVIAFSGGGAGAVQATATAVRGVGRIRYTNPGSGYTTPPTVTIGAAPVGGATATANSIIAANGSLTTGRVGDILVTNAGSGYTYAPQVTLLGGGQSQTAVAYANLTNTKTYFMTPMDTGGMGFERYYGRLTAQLGTNAIPYYFVDPVTEIWQDSLTLPGDATMIWRVAPLGIDSHPLHWHLVNLQIIGEITGDNMFIPPDPENMGWKETIKINPACDLILAIKPVAPTMNFALPDSIRPLSPAEPIGAISSFTNMLPDGTITAVSNQMTNFGEEYVWHCHILSHEENDMMRPINFRKAVTAPAIQPGQSFTLSVTEITAVNLPTEPVVCTRLSWTDPTPATPQYLGNTANEQGFRILRLTGTTGTPTVVVATLPANTTTWMDGTITQTNQNYRYRVQAFNKIGTLNSNVAGVTSATLMAVPAVPGLTSPAAGTFPNVQDPIPFSWGAVTGATSYTLQILSGANVVVNMPGLIAPNITLPNGQLVPGPYTWKVSATGPRGTSDFSAAIAFTGNAPPVAPSNLAASVMSATRVDLTWTDNSPNETGFIVQRAPDVGGVAGTWADIVLSGNPTAANAITFSDTSAPTGVTLYYRVVGTNAIGNGPPSAEVVTSTTAPNPATGVTANAINPTMVTLVWSHASNENGFDIERELQVGGTWAVLGTSPTVLAGVHTYTDTTAAPNTAYNYRVWPFNGVGPAATADVMPITTPAAPAAPTLNLPTTTANQVNLAWVDLAVNEDGFVIERAPDDGSGGPGVPGAAGTWATIFTTAAHQTNYVDTPTVGGIYWYRVTAFWGDTFSTASNLQSVILTPAAPSALSAVRTSATNVNLTWVDSANEEGFIVQRAPESSPGSGVPGTFAQLGGTLPANTTTFSDTNAPIGTGNYYYYRVQAYAGGLNSGFSNQLTVGPWTAPPGRPAIPTQPANGATWGTNTPTLNWYASSQAATYTVQISTTTSFAALVVNQAGIVGTSFTTPVLNWNTRYYWRVSAQNDLGTSAQSATWSLRTAAAATVPARPTQLYPTSGSTVPDQTPPLVWNPAAAATTYNVQVATTTAFTTPVVNQTGITGTQFDVPVTLTLNTLYYWRVQAQNVTGVSAWSTTRSFRVSSTSATAVPSRPIQLSPVNGATQVGNMPVLYWYPAPGAATYTVQVATSTAFTTLLVNQPGVTGTSFTCPTLPAGIKYWRVSAQNANGTSAVSTTRSFTP